MNISLPPATIIRTDTQLQAHTARWASEPLLAIDTESNSLHAYQEQVCLIQLSTREADFIIDPLMVEDLTPVGDLLANPAIEIVFHAAEYDIMCLKRDFGFTLNNLFDTMLAARICGAKKLGLGSMLEAHFDVHANKKYQRANWGERPLSAEMLQYAQLDTHYLPELRDYWLQQLKDMNRWEEAQENLDFLCKTPAAYHPFDEHGFWRINGARDLSLEQLAILRELYLFRDDTARRHDSPPFKVMNDRTMVDLAAFSPRNSNDLRGIKGMTTGQIRRYGADILHAVERGLKAGPPRRPPAPPRPDDAVLARFEALRNWRKQRARQRGVESDVIISKDSLWSLAERLPRSLDELYDVRGLGPWRIDTYGVEILDVLSRANGHPSRRHRRR